MPAILPRKLQEMARADDPAKAIRDALGGAVDSIDVAGDLVLVGTYIPPDRHEFKGKGGVVHTLLLTDNTSVESLYQGCVGLVLKKGKTAFVDDPQARIFWGGQDVIEGDWVVFRYSDAWEAHLNGVSVRFVDARNIKATIGDPRYLSEKPHPALR